MAKPLVKVGIEAPGYRPSRPFKAASPILVHTEEVTVEAVQPGVCAATVPARSAWWAGACPRYAAGRAALLPTAHDGDPDPLTAQRRAPFVGRGTQLG